MQMPEEAFSGQKFQWLLHASISMKKLWSCALLAKIVPQSHTWAHKLLGTGCGK